VKLVKHILVFLLVSISVAGRPHSGLWEQIDQDENFYTEVFFQAEMGVWIFEYTSYLVDLDGNPTKRVATSQFLSGRYYKLSGKFSSILMCKTEKYLQNGIPKSFKDKDRKNFVYAFRLTSPTTATFGRIMGRDIYEAYYFVKREESK